MDTTREASVGMPEPQHDSNAYSIFILVLTVFALADHGAAAPAA